MSQGALTSLSILLLASVLVACGSTPEPTQAPEPIAPPPTQGAQPEEPAKLILATTTSTQDSGLLDYLLPGFEDEYNAQVEVIAVGTGQAMALGEDGNADVLLVHDRSREDAFMDASHGVRREDVMYNDFVIVGPASDPAGIQGMGKAGRAFTRIAEAEAPFVSRGDDSGTHGKEKAIWAGPGIEPAGDWYISAGQGMGAVLTMADEQQAYTLSDRATYLARTLEGTDLLILVQGDPILFNPYGVIAVNPDKSPQINNELANQFIDWLISLSSQEKIAEFGVAEFGAPLFAPDSTAWREAQGSAEQLAGEAALRMTGAAQEIAWTEADLKAMDTLDVDYTDKDGVTTTYTGVLITILLKEGGVTGTPDLSLVAGDGYVCDLAAADYQDCADCIVAFDPEGGLRSVLPTLGGKAEVKDLVEIQVTGSAAPAEGSIPAGAALKITGNVDQEIGWLEEDVRAMETLEAESTNKQGETQTYTGVSLNTLLEMASPAADATAVVFVADDGYTAEVTLAEVQACTDGIVSFRNQGGFSIVMPGFPGNVQVKGLIEIQVK